MKEHDNYYFYLESSVFLFRDKDKALLYNTVSFKSILIKEIDKELSAVLNALAKPENMYSVLITQKQYAHKSIADFVLSVRKRYFGDMIPDSICKEKPVVMMPILNFQIDRKRKNGFKDMYVGNNIMELLSEINIYLEDSSETKKQMPDKLIVYLLEILKPYKPLIYLHGNNPAKCQILPNIQHYTLENNLSVCYCCDYLVFYEAVKIQQVSFNRFRLLVNSSFDKNKLILVLQFCKEKNINSSYEFLVRKESDLIVAEEFIINNSIDNYIIKPEYKNNLGFFEKNVFLKQADVLASKLTKRQIFAQQVINTYNFGKLHIKPSGDVYSDLNSPKIGNITKQSLPQILYQEMKRGDSWFRIRDKKPCNKCVFQWLCPSPSDYEFDIGKPNLCHIKQ
jgi:pseudo-rSAM protein